MLIVCVTAFGGFGTIAKFVYEKATVTTMEIVLLCAMFLAGIVSYGAFAYLEWQDKSDEDSG